MTPHWNLPIPPDYGDVILVGGPMHGYRVPSEHQCGQAGRLSVMTFPIHAGPRVTLARYRDTGRVRVEFRRDVPIYEFVPQSGA